MLRDWKDKVAFGAVCMGLSVLICLGGVLLMNGGGDPSATVTMPTIIVVTPTPTAMETLVDYDALMKSRCDERGYVWDDGVCRTVEGQRTLERIQEEFRDKCPSGSIMGAFGECVILPPPPDTVAGGCVGDYDCAGGSGDGPCYIRGPVWVGDYDPYGLDGDDDGWGCE